MQYALDWTIIGVLLTLATILSTVVYRAGHVSARVEELEKWRTNIRQDMHEISEKIDEQSKILQHLATVIEERTDRRALPRTTKLEGKY